MKKIMILFAVITILFLAIPQYSFAQMGWGMMGNYNSTTSSTFAEQQKTLDNATNSVLKSQNVSSISQLNCSKISEDQFEKVGDAWMGVMAGSEQDHSIMEQQMGGEGSQTLKQAHIQMGERYLGCSTSANQNGWMNMMDGRGGEFFPMMGWGYGNMMIGSFGWGFGVLGLIFWLVAFIDLVLLGVFLWRRITLKK